MKKIFLSIVLILALAISAKAFNWFGLLSNEKSEASETVDSERTEGIKGIVLLFQKYKESPSVENMLVFKKAVKNYKGDVPLYNKVAMDQDIDFLKEQSLKENDSAIQMLFFFRYSGLSDGYLAEMFDEALSLVSKEQPELFLKAFGDGNYQSVNLGNLGNDFIDIPEEKYCNERYERYQRIKNVTTPSLQNAKKKVIEIEYSEFEKEGNICAGSGLSKDADKDVGKNCNFNHWFQFYEDGGG